MSDPNNGEPVDTTPADETSHVDDVVGRANEGLADAEAASRDAVVSDASAADAAEPVSTETPAHHDLSYIEAAEAAHTAQPAETVAPAPVAETVVVAAAAAPAADAATTAYPEAVTPSEPVAAPAPQPIFVQAPEAPRPRGNRAAAGAIGLLAALVFGILYLAAALGLRAVTGDLAASDVAGDATGAVTSWWFWVPVIVFFLAFWLLGAIINRGTWGNWVIFGLLVGAAAYGGHLLGQLFQAPFWTLTASQGAELVEEQLLAPLAIVAFILGREITIWFGAWAAARGKRVTELNIEAQREYERTLEAGPQLHRL